MGLGEEEEEEESYCKDVSGIESENDQLLLQDAISCSASPSPLSRLHSFLTEQSSLFLKHGCSYSPSWGVFADILRYLCSVLATCQG